MSTSIIWQATAHPCVYLRSSAMLPSIAGLAYMAGRFKAAGQRYQAISTVTAQLTWRPPTVRGRRRSWPTVIQPEPCDLSATPAPSRPVRGRARSTTSDRLPESALLPTTVRSSRLVVRIVRLLFGMSMPQQPWPEANRTPTNPPWRNEHTCGCAPCPGRWQVALRSHYSQYI